MTSKTPSAAEIELAVITIIHEDLYVDEEFGVDDSLREDLGLDSLAFVELRAACEKHFAITISESDFNSETFASVRQLAALVARNVSDPAA